MSLMAELGEGPPPAKQNNSMLPAQRPPLQQQPPIQSRFSQPPPNPMVSVYLFIYLPFDSSIVQF